MSKIGRNDPCHCGSGLKYKRCCLQKDQATESAARAAEHDQHHEHCDFCGAAPGEGEDALTRDSNAVVDLVQDGKLDEAERAARALLERYPEVHDGYDRLGMVYEARGERQQAADCYRQVIDFIHAHPDQYEPDFETIFQQLIDKLDVVS